MIPDDLNPREYARRIKQAIALIYGYWPIDGERQKNWVMDRVVRELVGPGPNYQSWLDFYNADEEREDWDEGFYPFEKYLERDERSRSVGDGKEVIEAVDGYELVGTSEGVVEYRYKGERMWVIAETQSGRYWWQIDGWPDNGISDTFGDAMMDAQQVLERYLEES